MTDTSRVTQAYGEGYAAFMRDESLSKNPYDPLAQTNLRGAWIVGWSEAEDEIDAELGLTIEAKE